MTTAPVVIVVDADPAIRSSFKFLISSVGLVESFDRVFGPTNRVPFKVGVHSFVSAPITSMCEL